jgi:hypothetical protein
MRGIERDLGQVRKAAGEPIRNETGAAASRRLLNCR